MSRPAPADWTDRVGDALLDTKSSEDHMNAMLQNALKQAPGVKGLSTENSKKQNTKGIERTKKQTAEATTGKTEKEDKEEYPHLKVTERFICNLFVDCYGDKSYMGLEQKNGLPITRLSKPNFAVWAAADGGGMLITCEGKNNDNSTLFNAIQQCAAYMLVHTFFIGWSHKVQKAVKHVYGVAVPGTNCYRDIQSDTKFAVMFCYVCHFLLRLVVRSGSKSTRFLSRVPWRNCGRL